MPQITSLEPQKRKKDRANVFIDNKFAFACDVEALLKHQLKASQNISQEKIDSIIKKDEVSKLFDSSLKFLSYRPRSKKEVEDYLTRKISRKENVKYFQAKESELITLVVGKLTKHKYIDDRQFATWWIEARSKSKPKGKSIIKFELIKKGIDKEIIENELSKITNQKELALKSIERKLPRWQKLPIVEFKKKIYSFLGARGFDFETIKEIVAQTLQKG